MSQNSDVKKIVMFDTSIASDNVGDEIIMNSVYREMNDILKGRMVLKHSTHTPIMHLYQMISHGDPAFDYYRNAEYRFIGGSNIFKKSLFVRRADWNINIFDRKFYKDVITIGCGSSLGLSLKVDKYTALIYKSILNKEYFHSVRDEKTKMFLESLGLKAINTGCVTLWSLTPERCKNIPISKRRNVIFTLTGYNRDVVNDQLMVDIIQNNYDQVYFWPQSIGDLQYYCELNRDERVIVINPDLKSFENILDNNDVDYVGTRLHGGICALQHGCRSIIISIDNRAEDMDQSSNLRCIKRSEIGRTLDARINESVCTDIHIDQKRIDDWKGQFV